MKKMLARILLVVTGVCPLVYAIIIHDNILVCLAMMFFIFLMCIFITVLFVERESKKEREKLIKLANWMKRV